LQKEQKWNARSKVLKKVVSSKMYLGHWYFIKDNQNEYTISMQFKPNNTNAWISGTFWRLEISIMKYWNACEATVFLVRILSMFSIHLWYKENGGHT